MGLPSGSSPAPAPPPPGGFGNRPPEYQVPLGPIPARQKQPQTGLVIILVVCGLVLAVSVIGALAAVSIAGVRTYVSRAKAMEARATLQGMAYGAVDAFEASELASPGSETLCPSARSPIPSSIQDVSGKKYLASPSEWRSDPGFSCLKFELSTPHYYQYDYTNMGDQFTGAARGDLDGDGITSLFEIKGRVEEGVLRIDPTIEETSPDE